MSPLTTRLFLPLLAVYFSLLAALRLSLGTALDIDEAEQVFLTQWLLPGYTHQPPLYTWLQWLVFQVTGVSVLGLAALKHSLLWGLCALLYHCMRCETQDRKISIAAVLLLFFVPLFAWEMLKDKTHSILLLFFSLAAITQLNRLKRRSTATTSAPWYDYIGFGLVIGLGLLSKYNFSVFLLALALAGSLLPAYRRTLLTPRILIAFCVALITVSWHLSWLIDHDLLVLGQLQQRLAQTESQLFSILYPPLHLLSTFALQLLSLLLPLFLAAWLYYYSPNKQHQKTAPVYATSTPSPRPYTDFSRLLGYTLLCFIGLFLILLLLSQATQVRPHWFIPILALLPAWIVLQNPYSLMLSRRYLYTALALMALMPLGLAARVFVSSWPETPRQNTPFAQIAMMMTTDTQSPAPRVWLTHSPWLAGNLRLQAPGHTLIVNHATPKQALQSLADAPALRLIWDTPKQAKILHQFVHTHAPDTQFTAVQSARAPYHYRDTQAFTLHYQDSAAAND